MGFRDEKNDIVGFDIDLAKEAGKRLGVEVTFKPIDWSAKEAELNGKRIDVLWNGLTITEERKANILFRITSYNVCYTKLLRSSTGGTCCCPPATAACPPRKGLRGSVP